ncbi:MAG: 2-amino-4-hydroxy-6-hydroxymethyldihydropteridine diphosphokinase [Flavisolibacter sp.]|jgi:2-amino-4-hydroxy-6-hydroxymethyldihydropteridine diphosphokinase|nr:2-amino-4-hydroxy-6-hydroxymethyldihydropteridine diphosphokinase [Flavisolibacter sp.]
MDVAYLLTGGNLGNRYNNLKEAKLRVDQHCGAVLAFSGIYETEAWGIKDQKSFLNQALVIETAYSAKELLEQILNIENSMGRIREEKYGPRLIDIDILFYGNKVIHEEGLQVPHPFVHKRRFALQCLAEIASDIVHPVFNKTVHELLAECEDPLRVKKWV